MRCANCFAELPSDARFCTNCGQQVGCEEPLNQLDGAPEPHRPRHAAPSYADAVGQARQAYHSQTPSAPAGYMPQMGNGGMPYGADMPPQGTAPAYWGQPPSAYQGAPGPEAPYPNAYGYDSPSPRKKSRKGIAIGAAAVAIAAVVGVGTCFAMGAGPFAGNGTPTDEPVAAVTSPDGGASASISEPTASMETPDGGTGVSEHAAVPEKPDEGDAEPFSAAEISPMEKLQGALDNIQSSGNFKGTYLMDMSVHAGAEGDVSTVISGDYTMENYNPDDMSEFKMHMTMDAEILGENIHTTIDYADGVAEYSMEGSGYDSPYEYSAYMDPSEFIEDSNILAYDADVLEDAIDEMWIDGNTVYISLDDDFFAKALEESGLSGMSSADGLGISVHNAELTATLGEDKVSEEINMSMDLDEGGYAMSADYRLAYTAEKM